MSLHALLLKTLHRHKGSASPPVTANPRSEAAGGSGSGEGRGNNFCLAAFCGDHVLEVNGAAARGWKLTEVATLLKKKKEKKQRPEAYIP